MYDENYEGYDPERQEPVKRKQKKHGNAGVWIAAAVLTLLIVAGGTAAAVRYYFLRQEHQEITVQQEESTPQVQLSESGTERNPEQSAKMRASVLDVSDVVVDAMPSVVAITNKSVQEVRYMFYGTMEMESVSSGSGFIIAKTDDELLIATNYHVIEGANSLTVCFSVDAEDEADTIVQAVEKGSEPEYDLSVVSVNLSDIPDSVRDQITVASLGDSGAIRVGEPAIAIGNALGYGQSVTLGIVSALNRSLTIDDAQNTYIQTDAAINFGNSGGALLNVDGEVIGINSAKAASSGVEGMGYAIPINDARPILESLINKETRSKAAEGEQAYLGVYVQDISSEAKMLYDIPNGIWIYEVAEGSPAEKAGLKRGDIISKIDGNSVPSISRFSELMEYYRAGETVDVELLTVDGGSYTQKETEVTFDEQPREGESLMNREGSGYGFRYPSYNYGY